MNIMKFMRKLKGFIKEKYSFVIIWKTTNIRSLIDTSHISSVLYEQKCNSGENYIGETGRNVIIRWDGMNTVRSVKIQSQQSIFIDCLNTVLTRKFLEEFQIK